MVSAYEMDSDFTSPSVVVNMLNASLHELSESPIDKRRVKSKFYSCNKIKKINLQ